MPANDRELDNKLRERFKGAAKAVKSAPAPKESRKRVSAPTQIKSDAREELPQVFRCAVYEGTTQVAVYDNIRRKPSKYLSLRDRLWAVMVKYAQAHRSADLVVIYTGPFGITFEGQDYKPGSRVIAARTDDLLASLYDDE